VIPLFLDMGKLCTIPIASGFLFVINLDSIRIVHSFFSISKSSEKIFRCKEHLYKRLRLSVGWSVRPLVRPPRCNYVENWLRRDCFERRRRKRKLNTSRFHYVAIPSHLGIRRSPCFSKFFLLRILDTNGSSIGTSRVRH
jgi:hypothetical protein